MSGTSRITFRDGRLEVPERPAVPCIAGDGIGPEVWAAARDVLDAAVEKCYGGRRAIEWFELPAGQSAASRGLELLPRPTIDAIREHRVGIKGPTMTPVGSGHRSINVALRQALDLYANVRPVRYFEGVAAPVRNPGALDVVIFRENTEDVYAGIEFEAGSEGARKVAGVVEGLGYPVAPDAGLGIKVISRRKTRRLVRAALEYALAEGRSKVTIVHKGNIMKATEGAFLGWGYDLVREEYQGRAVARPDIGDNGAPAGTVVVDDRIADAAFQELLINPHSFDVLAAPNLNGDYLSDACAAQVGGLGIAPGANYGDGIAVFEPVHGSAPDIAGKGIANPGSMILSGALLLKYLGWTEASERVVSAFARVVQSGVMTVDLAQGRDGISVLGTAAFGRAVVDAL